jgi:hypothetical protein
MKRFDISPSLLSTSFLGVDTVPMKQMLFLVPQRTKVLNVLKPISITNFKFPKCQTTIFSTISFLIANC